MFASAKKPVLKGSNAAAVATLKGLSFSNITTLTEVFLV